MTRVLVVDDYEDTAETMAELLRLKGYDARSLSDGRAVLDTMRGWTADAVLMDYVLGSEGNGDKLLRELLEEFPATRVCVYTGLSTAVATLASERVAVFLKPNQFEDVLKALEHLAVR